MTGTWREHVWLDDIPMAQVSTAGTAYFHVDQLNTPQKMTDASQAVVWQAGYTPFGEATVTSSGGYDNPLRFPGQYFDAETGLHQNWNRDYDPAIGRYLQSDPIGLRGGLNTYAYVAGNPIRFVDPKGLQAEARTVCDGNGGFMYELLGAAGKCDEGCSRKHEQQHVDDLKRERPNSCRNRPQGSDPGLDPTSPNDYEFYKRTECAGHKVGLKCRQDMTSNSCFMADCDQRLQQNIEAGKRQVIRFCGSPM